MRGSALLIVALAAACGDEPALGDQACAPEDAETLDYAGFGRPFFAAHCDRCHAREAVDRHGAPHEFTFDSPAEIREHADRVFARAAVNSSMPPGPDKPSGAERDLLGRWLACGAP